MDESNLTWLAAAPKIKLLPQNDARKSYSLFKVNTGLRDQEVCQLPWVSELPIPELNTSIFIIPGAYCKHELGRLIPPNEIALQVIVRGTVSASGVCSLA
ncbi:MAG: hypothetical protein JSR33_12290 [Proteobacteria bacterium]|nr:hypothetical protein [Pseudomonadota bacterium]